MSTNLIVNGLNFKKNMELKRHMNCIPSHASANTQWEFTTQKYVPFIRIFKKVYKMVSVMTIVKK
jgi:hypothetical protein